MWLNRAPDSQRHFELGGAGREHPDAALWLKRAYSLGLGSRAYSLGFGFRDYSLEFGSSALSVGFGVQALGCFGGRRRCMSKLFLSFSIDRGVNLVQSFSIYIVTLNPKYPTP